MAMASLAELTTGLFPDLPQTAPPPPTERQIRSRDRAAQWRADMERHFHSLKALAKSEDDHAALDRAYEAALKAGPDFARVRRDAKTCGTLQGISGDRNELHRLLFYIEAIARGTWNADRRHAKERGKKISRTIAASVLPVLRALVRLATKHDAVFPSYEGLAVLSCLSRATAIAAIKTLEAFGFITVTRRWKRIRTPLGIRAVQDTNCYTLHAPRGLGAMALKIFGVSSGSKNPPARDSKTSHPRKEVSEAPKRPPSPPPQRALEPLPDAFDTPKRRIQWWELLRR